MRVAIRFSEYKAAGKLPFRESFNCSVCLGTDTQEKRNCRGEFGAKYSYTIGTTQFDQCPVSLYAFDPEVLTVIDLVMTSIESGIPVVGSCLLDQTSAFFEYVRIIRDERRLCGEELEKLRQEDMKREQAASKRQSAKPRGRFTPRARR